MIWLGARIYTFFPKLVARAFMFKRTAYFVCMQRELLVCVALLPASFAGDRWSRVVVATNIVRKLTARVRTRVEVQALTVKFNRRVQSRSLFFFSRLPVSHHEVFQRCQVFVQSRILDRRGQV
jgi:hypothetical protein